MKEKVEILMAVYNGESYIEEQLQSIVNQSYENWVLKIRDDGSTDKTLTVIEKFTLNFPDKIFNVNDELRNLGSCNNFFELLRLADSNYIMFADQDDIWNADKIEKTLSRFLESEAKYGKLTPLLLHTDIKVVDENLNPLADSFWKYQQMDVYNSNTLNKLLLQNIVTGCTAMFNKALREKALPLPANVFVHDWWLAIIAAAFGKIEVINEPTLLYRQHAKNVAGAKQSGASHFISRLFNLEAVKKGLDNSIFQAGIFMNQFKNELSAEQYKMLAAFHNLYRSGFFKRRIILLKYGILKTGFIRNIGLFLVA